MIKYLKLAATREGHLLTRQKTATLKPGNYTHIRLCGFPGCLLRVPPFHSNLEHVSSGETPARPTTGLL